MATRELSGTYGSISFGGSTARQITGYSIEEASWDVSAFEFEFITTAADDSSFAAELATIRNAFRTPRQDLVVTQNGQNLVSWKQSNNTGFDANPRILKDGDPADTGRSRHFRVRIEFGQPADQISALNFRRFSNPSISYDPSRRRTVTITGAYTANSTDGTTGAHAQYRAQITAYGASICSFYDSTATWEVVGEPNIERNDTDKVVTFTIIFRESIHNQSAKGLDDPAIVDPEMTIVRERLAPGDSTTGGFTFGGGGGGGQFSTGSGGVDTGVMVPTSGGTPGQTVTQKRPQRILLTYTCSIDQTKTKDIAGLWTSTLRSFLIKEAATIAEDGVTLIKESPGFIPYGNKFQATMEFISYLGVTKFEQKIVVSDRIAYGRILAPVTSADPYAYYERPGPKLRQRTVNITFKQKVGSADPNAILDGLVEEAGASVSGLSPAEGWMAVSSSPAVGNLVQGLDGGDSSIYAEVTIERVAQRRNKVKASVANAGGVTGAGLT